MGFYVGLDLGQAADYTALAVVQSVVEEKPEGGTQRVLHLRHLERYYPQTSMTRAAFASSGGSRSSS